MEQPGEMRSRARDQATSEEIRSEGDRERGCRSIAAGTYTGPLPDASDLAGPHAPELGPLAVFRSISSRHGHHPVSHMTGWTATNITRPARGSARNQATGAHDAKVQRLLPANRQLQAPSG